MATTLDKVKAAAHKVMRDIMKEIRSSAMFVAFLLAAIGILRTAGVLADSASVAWYGQAATVILIMYLSDKIVVEFKSKRIVLVVRDTMRPTKVDYLRWFAPPVMLTAATTAGLCLMLTYKAQINASDYALAIWAGVSVTGWVVISSTYTALQKLWSTEIIASIAEYNAAVSTIKAEIESYRAAVDGVEAAAKKHSRNNN